MRKPWTGPEWEVRSHSEPDVKHKVRQHPDGHFSCSCGKFIFHKNPKVDCHHILDVKTSLDMLEYEREMVAAAELTREVSTILHATKKSAPVVQVRTAAFTITELSPADLLTAPRKVRKGGF